MVQQSFFRSKSYGTSTHERTFESESAETERVFIEAVQKLHVLGLTLRAMTRNYPSTADWKALRQSLPTILGQTNYGRGPLHPVEETWAVAIADPPQEVLPLSNTRLSYQVLFLAPYHQNESKNLFDKLDDAAANARKYAGAASGDSARAVMVRLPETISFAACREWAQTYVADNPNGPIDFVMLYQPRVTDSPDGTSSIDHAFAQCPATSYSTWLRPGRQMNITVLVGVISGGSNRTLGTLVGGPNAPDIGRMYLYQHGEFFTVSDWKPGSPVEGRMHLSTLAPRQISGQNSTG